MIPVIFAQSFSKRVSEHANVIIISPNHDRWNDFGFHIRAEIQFPTLSAGAEALRLPILFGSTSATEKQVSDVDLLVKLISDSSSGWLDSEKLPGFFTMLPNIGSYRAIVSRFGPKIASQYLESVHDLVAADERYPSVSWFREAKETIIFRQAFLRSSEAFFAWTNAGAILQGFEFEEVGLVSNALEISFRLVGRPNEHKLNFKFDVTEDTLPRRFSVIIGKNGVGKSQALGHIAEAAIRGGSELTDGIGERPSINRLLAFAPTATTFSVFPNDRRKNPKIWYRRFTLGQSGAPRGRQSTPELLVQLARSQESIRTIDRFQLFLQAIRAIDGWQELQLRTSREYGRFVRLEELSGGSEQARLGLLGAIEPKQEPVRVIQGKAYPLSSGEQSFLRFAAIASLHIENGTLVLLDEPETHLHPNFISQFAAVLDNLLRLTGSVAIIATHSVYFVREAFEDQVIVLRSGDDRAVFAEKPTLKTFGADVGSISYFVFGEDQPSTMARGVEGRIAASPGSWSDIFERYKDELSPDLLAEIRARMEPPKPVRET